MDKKKYDLEDRDDDKFWPNLTASQKQISKCECLASPSHKNYYKLGTTAMEFNKALAGVTFPEFLTFTSTFGIFFHYGSLFLTHLFYCCKAST